MFNVIHLDYLGITIIQIKKAKKKPLTFIRQNPINPGTIEFSKTIQF
jgi:hypothetical protein